MEEAEAPLAAPVAEAVAVEVEVEEWAVPRAWADSLPEGCLNYGKQGEDQEEEEEEVTKNRTRMIQRCHFSYFCRISYFLVSSV